MRSSVLGLPLLLCLGSLLAAQAQVAAPYNAVYSLQNLGAVPGLPGPSFGGLTIQALDTDYLLIGGGANNSGGALYRVQLVRNGTNHIVGFSGSATRYADAAFNDGSVSYGPDNVLFLTRYPQNSIGQTRYGSTLTDRIISLAPTVGSTPGGIAFVPPGYPNAGHMKIVSYSGGAFYDATVSPDGNGTYDINNITFANVSLGTGPEGIAYVPPGSPLFGNYETLLVCELSSGRVSAYTTDANATPILATKRNFITGLTSAMGATFDPVTGDFLCSRFNTNQVFVVTGFRAEGLFANFAATPSRGVSPLTVQFTDQTFTSDLGGVTSWAWDFNGDNSPDSTLQNPSWVFDCGSHSVSLTVTDATHAPSTMTRANLIVTDIVTPNFSYQAVGGNVVNFTDTTTPAATSWAWDFNEDNIIDSLDQNPSYSYPSTALTSRVRLTANRVCGPAASVNKVVVTPTLALPTLFTGGIGLSNSGAGNCFDLTVTNPLGVNLTGVTMCPSAAASLPIGTPLTVDVYITRAPGGYASNHTNAAVWRRVATGSGLYRGGTAAAPVPIDMSFAHGHYLPPGSYGVALHMNGCGVASTTGTASNRTYANADVTVQCGNAKSQRFNFQNLTPRVWNGVLYYDLGGQTDFTPPIANAGLDMPIGIGNVYLDGSGSSDETSSISDLEYEWTLTAKPSTSTAVLNGANLGPTGPWFHVDVWGEYRVSLVVVDLQGNRSDPDEVVFTLPQDITPPTAYAGDNQSIHVGWISLDGSASYDDITTSSALVYEWTLVSAPTGSNAWLYYSTYYNPWQYSYDYLVTDVVGEYRVSLVVIDEQGNRSAPSEVVLSTTNMVPVAIAGADQVGVVNSWVLIYGWESYDPDYDGLYYSWTITSAPIGSNAYFAYGGSYYYDYLVADVAGTYEIQLIVNDPFSGYSAPDTVSVVVVTPAQWAAIRLGEASTQIGTFDLSVFDAPGHKNSLRNQLAQIANFIAHNNLTQARAHLEDVISRTDGWPLRYAFDPKGAGQPFPADFIVGYYEQYDIWYRLQEALSYLNQ